MSTKRPPEPLTPDEARALIRECPDTPSGIRDKALLATMYRCGLRISEALDLRPKDVGSGIVRILHGKGDRARVVGLDPSTAKIIDGWRKLRHELGIDGSAYLFCSLGGAHGDGERGKRMNSSYTRRLVAKLGKRAGIEKRCHPHGLRHTLAFELANEGVDYRKIQRILGHLSLATTEKYINHLSPKDAIDAVQGRKWSL